MHNESGITLRRFGSFELLYAVFAPRDGFAEHRHGRAHLTMVFSGTWLDRNEAYERQLGAGEVLFHPEHFVHTSGPVNTETEVVVLRFSNEVVRAFCPLYGNVARDVQLPFEVLRGVPDRIREELTGPDEAAPIILESLAMQLLALGSRTSTQSGILPPTWFPAALNCIHREFPTALTVRRIAAEAGISPSRLAHVFQAVMGRSIAVYIRECRVRAAAKALRESDIAIGEIAAVCGFYDQAHLTRAFKALRSATPLQYRRSQRRQAGGADEVASALMMR